MVDAYENRISRRLCQAPSCGASTYGDLLEVDPANCSSLQLQLPTVLNTWGSPSPGSQDRSTSAIRKRYGSRLRKAAAFQKGAEPRRDPVGVPLGIHGQKQEVDVANGVRPIKPLEHRLRLTQTGAHERHGIRRHVPALREV